MKKAKTKNLKTLNLSRETIRELTDLQITRVVGGWIRPPITWSCPQP